MHHITLQADIQIQISNHKKTAFPKIIFYYFAQEAVKKSQIDLGEHNPCKNLPLLLEEYNYKYMVQATRLHLTCFLIYIFYIRNKKDLKIAHSLCQNKMYSATILKTAWC